MTTTKKETVRSVLKLAAEWLEKKGVDAPRLDAELLLAKVLKLKRLDLYLDHDRPLKEDELEPFRALLRRRAAREPVAYLLGEREFYALAFEVTPDVLVPRPETEDLVTLAVDEAGRHSSFRFADVGTGSGCIAISLLAKAHHARGVATDVSEKALAVATRNAAKHNVTERLELVKADLLAGVAGPLDAVFSNPPYVLPSEKKLLAPELSYEPQNALFDVAEDLPTTRRLALEAKSRLRPGGLLAIETGAGSAPLVRRHLEAAGFVEIATRKDLDGHERIVLGRA